MKDGGAMNNREFEIEDEIDPLAEYEQLFRTVFEMSDEAILVVEPDVKGHIIEANQSAADMHGYTIQELVKLKASDLHPSEELADIENALQRILEGEWVDSEHEHVRKDGSRFPVRSRSGVTQYLGRRVIISFTRDIGIDKQLEEALRQCERDIASRI